MNLEQVLDLIFDCDFPDCYYCYKCSLKNTDKCRKLLYKKG